MSCESGCVAECCGVGAFDFSQRRIEGWLKRRARQDRDRIAGEFEDLLRSMASQSDELVRSDELNQEWSKAKAIEFFSGLHRIVKGVS